MPTLKQAIDARTAELTGQMAAIKDDAAARVKDLQDQVYAEQKKLESLGPWLNQELSTAKQSVADVFAAYESIELSKSSTL